MIQKSSSPRVKKDTIGSDAMEELFKVYDTASVEEFQTMCLHILDKSSASTQTKTKFNTEINHAESKKHMLFLVTNFFLAGEGKGV